MANDSVGKISLDLEVQSDLSGQISGTASKIGSQIEESLKNASGALDPKKMVNGISEEMQKTLSNVMNMIDTALARCTQAAKADIDIIGERLNAMIDQAMARITNVKNPFSIAEEPSATAGVTSRPLQPRAPPVAPVKAPKIQVDLNADTLERQAELVEATINNLGKQIEIQEAKLADLKAAYEHTFNETKKNKIQEQVLKTEGSIISLQSKIEDLGARWDAMTDKVKAMRATSIPNVGSFAGKQVTIPKVNMSPKVSGLTDMSGALDDAKVRTMASAEQINQALSMIGRGQVLAGIQAVRLGITGLLKTIGGGLVSGARKAASSVGRLFGTIGSGLPKLLKASSGMMRFGLRTKKAGDQSRSAQSGMHRMLTTMLRYQVIIPMIMGALRGMAKSLWASMNANEQFKNSLSQIRSNLNVAFTPIYQAIMPALNTLMAALAKITGYIAAFTSMLFGKTVSGSVAATKSLVAAKSAMGAYGSSAKKAAKDADGVTTGIDELNIIQAENDDSGGGGGGSAPEITAPDIDTEQMGLIDSIAENVRNVLGQLFKPMRDSWEAEGQNTLNAALYAFSNVIELAQVMGRSFLEVWTNGSGERFCTNILQLVTLVLNIIGDIAGAFTRAWQEGDRGTRVVQSIFDRLNSTMELIHTIGESFRDVWNSGTGESVIGHILEIFTNINDTITHIQDNFRKAWELDGTGTAILQNLADILDELLGSVDKITKSLSDWSSKLDFTPIMSAFERMSEALKPLGDKVGKGLEWLFSKVLEPLGKWAVEQAIPAAIDAISGAFGVLNGILDLVTPLAELLWNNILQPLAEWTGGTIVEIVQGITDVFHGLTDIFTEISNGTDWNTIGQMLWEGLINGISSFGEWAWEKAKEIFWGIVDTVKDLLGIHSPSTVFSEIGGYLVEGLLNGLTGSWSGLIETVQGLPGELTELFRSGYEGIQNVFSGIGDWFGGKWEDVKTALGEAPDWFSEKFTSARTGVTEAFQSVGTWFSERYTDVTTAFKDSPTWFSDTFKSAYKKLTGAIQPIGSWFQRRYTDVTDAFKNSPTWFKTTFQSAYDNITTVVSPIGGWFGERYVDVQNAFKDSPEWFKTTFQTVSDNIQTVFNGLISFITGVFSGDWEKAWNGVKDVFKGIFNGVVDLVENAMNYIVDGINDVLSGIEKVADTVGDLIGLDIDIPSISRIALPRLAAGGYVGANQPQLAMIGDNRHYGEIVAPEDKMQAMVDKAVAMAARPDDMSEQYLIVMIDLLKKIIELIESLDLVINFDTREIKKKLADLDKRTGYTLRPA